MFYFRHADFDVNLILNMLKFDWIVVWICVFLGGDFCEVFNSQTPFFLSFKPFFSFLFSSHPNLQIVLFEFYLLILFLVSPTTMDNL